MLGTERSSVPSRKTTGNRTCAGQIKLSPSFCSLLRRLVQHYVPGEVLLVSDQVIATLEHRELGVAFPTAVVSRGCSRTAIAEDTRTCHTGRPTKKQLYRSIRDCFSCAGCCVFVVVCKRRLFPLKFRTNVFPTYHLTMCSACSNHTMHIKGAQILRFQRLAWNCSSPVIPQGRGGGGASSPPSTPEQKL